MSPAFMFTIAGSAALAQAATNNSLSAPTASEARTEPSAAACPPHEDHNIVVCGQRGQAYRLDPNIVEASRGLDREQRSVTGSSPAAQATCSSQPTGCGKDLGSLDLANVAIVAGTMAVRALKGKDWAAGLRTGGPDEYQLYQQAKRRREAAEQQQAAARVKTKARQAEREEHQSNTDPR